MTKINQYLNTDFVVSSFIKPRANIKQIVHYQETEFNPLNAELIHICHLLALLGSCLILHIIRIRVKCLGRKDIIVVNGGTYDFDSNAEKRKSALVHMPQFA